MSILCSALSTVSGRIEARCNMTQILEARKGNITPEMEAVARAEGVKC